MLRLPITRDQLKACLQPQREHFSHQFNIFQLASVILLARLPALSKSTIKPGRQLFERALSELVENGNEVGLTAFQQLVAEEIKATDIQQAIPLLGDLLDVMGSEEWAEAGYSDAAGEWRWGYGKALSSLHENQHLKHRSRRKVGVSEDQNRFLDQVMAEPDESVMVQGFAGTGKTFLLSRLVELLPHARFLVLASTSPQVRALQRQLTGTANVTGKTLGELADEVLSSNLLARDRRVGLRGKRKYTLSFDELAQRMGYRPLGELSARDVARLATRTVNRFCYSGHPGITQRDLPVECQHAPQSVRATIAELASQLWEAIIHPPAGIELPIRDYHRLKHLALLNEPIPRKYSHVLLDESHDLPTPVLQILEQSPQAVIAMGDQYQADRLVRVSPARQSGMRARTLSHSLRMGFEANDTVNLLLQAHPVAPDAIFEGATDRHTEIQHYEKLTIPDQYCALLAQNTWQVLELLQKLAHRNARFRLLGHCERELRWLIQDAIAFSRDRIRPTHPELLNERSWQAYVQRHPDAIVRKVHDLFEQGYSEKHLEASLAKQVTTAGACYQLGRLEDSRNREFDSVVLAGKVNLPSGASPESKALFLNRLYTGVSRARHRLSLPGELNGRVQDLAKKR